MKKVGYLYLVSLIILVCLLVSCSKQQEPEPTIISGGNQLVLLDTDGQVWHMNGFSKKGPELIFMGDEQNLNSFKQIAVGLKKVVLIDKKGKAWAFGSNDKGQLGIGEDISMKTIPSPVAMLNTSGKQMKNIVQVAAGGLHTVLLDKNGYVWTVGANDYGQLGNGIIIGRNEYAFALMADPKKEFQGKIKQVLAGGLYTILIDNKNQMWLTGFNEYGKLGNGGLTGSKQFYAVKMIEIESAFIKDVTQITAGYNHTIFLDKDGYVWGAGLNDAGQLGLGSTEIRTQVSPILMPDANESFQGNIVEVAAGVFHTILLDKDGHVWATGLNHQGQLGFGDDSEPIQYTPQMMTDRNGKPIGNIKQVSGGYSHTLLLDEDNMVWIVGDTDLDEGNYFLNTPGTYFPVKLMQL